MADRIALAGLLVAASFAAAGWLVAWGRELPEVLARSLSSAAVEGIILALAVGAAVAAPGPARERLGLVRGRLGAVEIAALAIGTLGLSHALDSLLSLTGLIEQSGLADFAHTLQGTRGLPLVAVAIAIGLMPALAEELLCRGVLQRSLVARLGVAPGIGLAALAFAAIHVEPIHATFALPLGVYLGVTGHWSANVLVPVACHAVNNLVAAGVAVLHGPTTSASPADVALGVIVAGAALAWVWRRRQGLQPARGLVDG